MLELKGIVKEYVTGELKVEALRGIDLQFRRNEFVAVLGSSGCGKTTMLNIIGGLDRYTRGDLIINGVSTKQYRDSDWDSYRNHSIGFVFQSYNLIPHQSVLANVELALTLSGVSKSERRSRAISALQKVGLGDQLHKRPSQMSGGQMQRVAIARALVNNPDILLADEPTGALDSQTSVQIMDLLAEVAEDRLVIMVTHNPELADKYATRIVRLSDGEIIDDTNPISKAEYEELCAKDLEDIIAAKKEKKAKRAEKKKKSMSFGTAISLSFKNLLTKKGRTVLTSLAGSIGIIGIALILALSNGIQLFIDQVQEDTLSTYPLTIMKETQDMSAMMAAMTQVSQENVEDRDPNKIYVDDSLDKMVQAMTSTTKNDLVSFKKYLDENNDKIAPYVSDIQYTYSLNTQVYNIVSSDGTTRYTKIGLAEMLSYLKGFESMGDMAESSGMMNVMSEMIDNQALLDQQYDVITGSWPQNDNEVVLVVGKNNQISKMTLYMLGVLDPDELKSVDFTNYKPNENIQSSFTFDELLGIDLVLLNTPDVYEKYDLNENPGKYYTDKDGNIQPMWYDVREGDTNNANLQKLLDEKGIKLKISGIIRPREDASATSISGAIGYTKGLTDKLLAMNTESEIIAAQKNSPDYSVITGIKFESMTYTVEDIPEIIKKIDGATKEIFYNNIKQNVIEGYKITDGDTGAAQKFMAVFSFMSDAERAELVGAMLSLSNPAMLPMIYNAASVEGFITVDSPEDLLAILPSLPDAQLMGRVMPSLMMACGEEGMRVVYTAINAAVDEMEMTDEMFLQMTDAMKASPENAQMLEGLLNALVKMLPDTNVTQESTLAALGAAEAQSPASINFYAKDFASKDSIEQFIADYNSSLGEDETDKKIEYTDIIGVMMSSITIIIDVISYVLIAFVSISLVVSSIMIGIITNISVLERTKEIGILRAIGASKKDISRVFNAETFIIGSAAGILGILITVLLCIPANAIIAALSGFENIRAVLPAAAAVILVIISMGLTMIAGLIPAKKASRKDPVEALRAE